MIVLLWTTLRPQGARISETIGSQSVKPTPGSTFDWTVLPSPVHPSHIFEPVEDAVDGGTGAAHGLHQCPTVNVDTVRIGLDQSFQHVQHRVGDPSR